MEKAINVHFNHLELISEVEFLKKEIDFLLKLLKNSYCTSLNVDKLKLLDGYWMGFENNIGKLERLFHKIKTDEKNLALLFKNNLVDPEKTMLDETKGLVAEFFSISKAVRTYKDSFYDFMENCNACSFKKHETV